MAGSTYLSAGELADLIDCEKNSFKCMRTWLDKRGWPYEPNRIGFPKVSRAYHDARMMGAAASAAPFLEEEPDFDALSHA